MQKPFKSHMREKVVVRLLQQTSESDSFSQDTNVPGFAFAADADGCVFGVGYSERIVCSIFSQS